MREAVKLLAEKGDDARVLAGGTDLIVQMRGRRFQPERVVDIKKIPEVNELTFSARKGLRIGAAVPCHTIYGNTDVIERFPGIVDCAMIIGGIQIQGRATIGGNLCNASPAADGVPPLLTLDAAVEIASLSGVRSVPLTEFVLGVRQTALQPGEMVTAVTVPVLPMHVSEGVGCFIKIGARKYLVISITMVAALVAVADGKIAEARVAVGACSTVAQRVPMLEAALRGCTAAQAEAAICPAHLEALSPISDMRGSASYRADAAFELCRRAVASALTGAAQNGGLGHG